MNLICFPEMGEQLCELNLYLVENSIDSWERERKNACGRGVIFILGLNAWQCYLLHGATSPKLVSILANKVTLK